MAGTAVQLTFDSETIEVDQLAGALAEFSAFLSSLDASLSPNGKRTLTFRVTKMTYNSPAQIGFEVESRSPARDNGPHVLRLASEGIREIQRGELRPTTIPYESLEHLRRLAGYARKPTARVVFDAPALEVEGVVTRDLGQKVDRVLARGDALGSIEGQLETVSVHGKDSFTIYDAVTGKGVRCYFPEGRLAQALAALGKRVIVQGLVRRDPAGVPREIHDVTNLHVPGPVSGTDGLAGVYGGLDVRAYLAEIRGE